MLQPSKFLTPRQVLHLLPTELQPFIVFHDIMEPLSTFKPLRKAVESLQRIGPGVCLKILEHHKCVLNFVVVLAPCFHSAICSSVPSVVNHCLQYMPFRAVAGIFANNAIDASPATL